MTTMDEFNKHFDATFSPAVTPPRFPTPEEELAEALAQGWVVQKGDRYILTEAGLRERDRQAAE